MDAFPARNGRCLFASRGGAATHREGTDATEARPSKADARPTAVTMRIWRATLPRGRSSGTQRPRPPRACPAGEGDCPATQTHRHDPRAPCGLVPRGRTSPAASFSRSIFRSRGTSPRGADIRSRVLLRVLRPTTQHWPAKSLLPACARSKEEYTEEPFQKNFAEGESLSWRGRFDSARRLRPSIRPRCATSPARNHPQKPPKSYACEDQRAQRRPRPAPQSALRGPFG